MKEMRPWLSHRAALTPHRTAVVCGDNVLDYQTFARCVWKCADELLGRGVEPGDVVAILLGNGFPIVQLLHALDHCGATLVPLNVRLTQTELTHQLRDSGAALLLHGQGELAQRGVAACEEVGGLGALEMSDAGALSETHSPRDLRKAASPNHGGLAILYTSGTTGLPKGALLTHGCFEASAASSALHLGVWPGDRWLVCMPIFHVGGLSIPIRSVLYGTAALLHERFDEQRVNHTIDTEGVTLVSLAPAMLDRLLVARGNRRAPPALRCVLLGGGPADSDLLERARELSFPVAPTYGLTEAASQVATQLPNDGASPHGAGLTPLPGTELRTVDPKGRNVGTGEAGEILVRSDTVMKRYVNRPLETREALRGGWLHTGDIGTLDDRGRLRVLDRRSDLIISGGENVYPAEVEAALLLHPAVLEAGVAAQPDRRFGSRPAAWLVVGDGAPSDEELSDFCRQRLAGYKVPASFHRVGSLPRNASGKLQRRHLTTA